MTETEFVIHSATKMGHVHLTVAGLERQIEFYQQVVGLRLHWREGQTAGMGAGAEDLLRLTELPQTRRVPGTTGLYHFAILYPNRRELARSIARLFSLRYPNYPTDHLMTETTYLDDPEGNGIELYADTPERGRWDMSEDGFGAIDSQGNPHSGREPLDIENLMVELQPDDPLDRAAPAGTVIGHVHLHVADIGEANGFYQGILGFEVQGVSRSVGVSFVSAGGYHHHIGLNIWLGQGAPPAPPDSLGLRYFTVSLPNALELDRVVDRLNAAEFSIQRVDNGWLVHDPFRNGILLNTL